MGGGLESCFVGHVYGADGAVRHHPHRTHDLHSGSQDHHPSTNSMQKTICCNSTSNAPDGVCTQNMSAKNISIKLRGCIKLAFHIISSVAPHCHFLMVGVNKVELFGT